MKRTHRPFFLALLLLTGSCVQPDLEPRFTPAWEPVDTTTGDWLRTREVMLVADCQFHNLYSKALPERDLSTKEVVPTAIRAPQLDLFSPDVLKWVLRNGAPDSDVILHLGDALDLACENEFYQFLGVMKQAGKPWFMAPGNHDFFYFGNYEPRHEDLWESACHGGGKPLHKDRFIRLYVSVILRQDDDGVAALAKALNVEPDPNKPLTEVASKLPEAYDWKAPFETKGFLKRISWKIDSERPWRSYILQQIDVTKPGNEAYDARVFLMDSCQYSRRPEFIPNGWRSYPVPYNCGLTGEMLPDQLRRLRAWIEDRGNRRGDVIMCHHPFEHLAPRSRSSLGWLWREKNLGMMVSAHTHKGYFAHHDLGGDGDEIELNIGSTTDWPMEWRTLQGFVSVKQEKIYLNAKRGTLVDALKAHGGFFDVGWEVPLNAPDDYRKYKQGEGAGIVLVRFAGAHHFVPYWLPPPRVKPTPAAWRTEVQVKDTLLWTYYRLVQSFPTDAGSGEPQWPEGLVNDLAVLNKILELTRAGDDPVLLKRRKKRRQELEAELESKVAFLKQLEAFERTRKTKDPKTGESLDDVRIRWKISQAAWASRFENKRGRRLRVEDDLIRIDWERAIARKKKDRAADEPEADD